MHRRALVQPGKAEGIEWESLTARLPAAFELQCVPRGAILGEMNKAANPDKLLAQIRAMPIAERHRVTAELLDDLDADFIELPALMDELRRRAEDAMAHPDRGISLEDSIAQARAAAAKVRAQEA